MRVLALMVLAVCKSWVALGNGLDCDTSNVAIGKPVVCRYSPVVREHVMYKKERKGTNRLESPGDGLAVGEYKFVVNSMTKFSGYSVSGVRDDSTMISYGTFDEKIQKLYDATGSISNNEEKAAYIRRVNELKEVARSHSDLDHHSNAKIIIDWHCTGEDKLFGAGGILNFDVEVTWVPIFTAANADAYINNLIKAMQQGVAPDSLQLALGKISDGTWRETCAFNREANGLMAAFCKECDNCWYRFTAIPYRACSDRQYSNHFGQLRCHNDEAIVHDVVPAPASDPGQQLPGGSYKIVCEQCAVNGAILSCWCLAPGGKRIHSAIPINGCNDHLFAVHDGWLDCENHDQRHIDPNA